MQGMRIDPACHSQYYNFYSLSFLLCCSLLKFHFQHVTMSNSWSAAEMQLVPIYHPSIWLIDTPLEPIGFSDKSRSQWVPDQTDMLADNQKCSTCLWHCQVNHVPPAIVVIAITMGYDLLGCCSTCPKGVVLH